MIDVHSGSHLIHSLSIKGDIRNGILSGIYTVLFKNDIESLVEASFICPLPPSCCPTEFSAKFDDEVYTSTIAHSDDSRLLYDDVLAQSDVGVIVQIIEDGKLRIDVGCLKNGEFCEVSVSFLTVLSTLENTLLLILPAIPNPKYKNSLTYLLDLQIQDDMKLSNITTPDIHSVKIELKNDGHEGHIFANKISVATPFRLCLNYFETPSRCILDCYENASYLYFTAKAPLAVRNTETSFILMIEQGKMVDSARLSLILRAIEFFALSIPNNCSINVIKYGDCLTSLFDDIKLINKEIRQQTLDFVRIVQPTAPHFYSFSQAQELINTKNDETVIIAIGTNFEETTHDLIPNVSYIFIDPLGKGDTRDFALRKNASYIPVSDQNSIFNAILMTIKMTSTLPISDAKLIVDGNKSILDPVLPAVTFERIVCVEKPCILSLNVQFGDVNIPIPIVKDDKSNIHFLYAFSELKHGDDDNINALMPADGGVVSFEREDEITDDVTFIEAKISNIPGQKPHPRIIQIQEAIDSQNQAQFSIPQTSPQPQQRAILRNQLSYVQTIDQQISLDHKLQDNNQKSQNAPHQMQGFTSQLPQLHSKQINRNPMKRNEQVVTQMGWESNSVSFSCQQPAMEQCSTTRFYNDGFIPQQKQTHKIPLKRTSFTPSIKEQQIVKKEIKSHEENSLIKPKIEEEKTEKPMIIQSKGTSKKMFFLLRLLQLQDEDGSWFDRNKMINCVGAEIPTDYDKSLDERSFLTCFSLASLMIKGKNDKEKWEILAEKAMLYLESIDKNRNWKEYIQSLEIYLR